MSSIKVSAIVAMSENRVIGDGNKLIWHLPEDLKNFKKLTMGKPLLMGRKSFESLPGVLPGRPHIVVSRSKPSPDMLVHDSVYSARSIEEGVDRAKELAKDNGQDEVFIAGGGEIYQQTLNQVECLYLTVVHDDFKGDTSFPKLQWEDWSVDDTIEYEEDLKNSRPAFTIMTLSRARKAA